MRLDVVGTSLRGTRPRLHRDWAHPIHICAGTDAAGGAPFALDHRDLFLSMDEAETPSPAADESFLYARVRARAPAPSCGE